VHHPTIVDYDEVTRRELSPHLGLFALHLGWGSGVYRLASRVGNHTSSTSSFRLLSQGTHFLPAGRLGNLEGGSKAGSKSHLLRK
jgi:hypothetical protein